MSRLSWRSNAAILRVGVPLALAACSHGIPSQLANTEHIPTNQVWVSSEDLRRMNVEVHPAIVQDVADTIEAGGRVSFDDSRVSHSLSPVSGRVTQILAQLGQHVRRGEPLVVIESPDVGIASSDLNKAEADSIAAEHDLTRQRELVQEGAASARDLEQAEDGARRAHAELLRARERMRLFHGSDAVTQTYTVRSEIEGEVVARSVSPGMEVQGQYSGGAPMELYTIGQLDRVWVMADVYEMDLRRVARGQHVTVDIVSYPGHPIPGTLDWLSGTLDPVTRTARVRVTLDNPEGLLRPEMYATVHISIDPMHTLAIPVDARIRLGDQDVVFVERGPAPGGRTAFERVTIGVDESISGPLLPVTSGLTPGARIVTNNAMLLVSLL